MNLDEALALYLYFKDQSKRNDIEERIYHEAWRLIASEANVAMLRLQHKRSG